MLACADGPAFVPLKLESAPATVSASDGSAAVGGEIRIEISGVVLQLAADCSPDRAAALAAALKRAL